MSLNPIANLLKTDAILFWSSYGSKAVAESWTQRLNKQIKSVENAINDPVGGGIFANP